jgi:methylenetetrahydrofolate reductase (NADPH)
VSASDHAPRDLAALLSSASVEVSSRGHQLQELRDHFHPGMEVTITFLPGDNYRHNVETAVALRRADVRRVLLIAGDVVAAKGPYRSSLDVCNSGLLEAHGVAHLSVAGHPEGHPYLTAERTFKGLEAWRDWGRQTSIRVDVVTQFCFESAPILGWIGELGARGIHLPVIVGLAGPASPATLTKFALRCGVGNSMRALRSQIGRFGRLLTDTGPDDVMRGLRSAPAIATASIAGFHLFPFGGLRKAAGWLRTYNEETLRQVGPAASGAGAQNP